MAGQSELASSLDAVLPRFDIRERHSIRVQAPADAVFRLASEIDFEDIWLIRVIVRTREWLLAGPPAPRTLPKRFLEYMTALGWGVLSAIPDREIVMGAVTQPWIAHPVFRALPPGEFLEIGRAHV